MIDKLVSVIVPVWNAELYLHYCVDSIRAQTYKSFELILVDDGSTDSSGDLCDQYQNEDERIHVIHRQNGGVSAARNTGLARAQGEWIFFVDNDDVLAPYALETLVNEAVEQNADIVQGTRENVSAYEQIAFQDNPSSFFQKVSFSPEQYVWSTQAEKNRYLYACHWGKLFKADIAKKYTFPEGEYGEDTQYCALVFSDSQLHKILYIDIVVYYYLLRESSACHSWDKAAWFGVVKTLSKSYSLILKNGNNHDLAAKYLQDFFKTYYVNKLELLEAKNVPEEIILSYEKLGKDHLAELFGSKLSLFQKMCCYFSCSHPALYSNAKKIYIRIGRLLNSSMWYD